MTTSEDIQALERLIQVAKMDTGQSGRVANFLLAWWNAPEQGGFDLTDLWAVDDALKEHMLTVIKMIANRRVYPDKLGYGSDFEKIIKQWR